MRTRKIIYSESMGVYIGHCLGLGFWSKLDPVAQTAAVTFSDQKEIETVLAEWDGLGLLPSDLRYLDVMPDVAEASGEPLTLASIDACVAAGAERWDPTDYKHKPLRPGPATAHADEIPVADPEHPLPSEGTSYGDLNQSRSITQWRP